MSDQGTHEPCIQYLIPGIQLTVHWCTFRYKYVVWESCTHQANSTLIQVQRLQFSYSLVILIIHLF